MISREHSEIRRMKNQDGTTSYYLLDRSLNGTYVNERRVSGRLVCSSNCPQSVGFIARVCLINCSQSLSGSLLSHWRRRFQAKDSVLLHPGDTIKFGHVNGAAIQPGQHAPQPHAEFTFVVSIYITLLHVEEAHCSNARVPVLLRRRLAFYKTPLR